MKITDEMVDAAIRQLGFDRCDNVRIRAALEAALSAYPQTVAVKPLEWTHTNSLTGSYHIGSGACDYKVEISNNGDEEFGPFTIISPYNRWPTNHRTLDAAKAEAQSDYDARIRSALTTAPAQTDEELYEIGKRDGYEEAVQEIDQLTGGDGEYRYCTDHDPERHTPGPVEMIQRIVDRFETLNLLKEAQKDGRDQEWGDAAAPATMTIEEYVEEYRFIGDGGDYTPNENEKAMLIDALHGAAHELFSREGAPAQELAPSNPFLKEPEAQIRAQAVEDVLSALTAHELYQYRPKAFQGFIDYARSELTTAPEQEPVAAIVPEHCSATNFVFEGGCLHVRKDGSGYIVVDEDDFILEDDRCEGPDGPEGSVHWLAKFPTDAMTALRDFLNGQRFPKHDQSARIAELEAEMKKIADQTTIGELFKTEDRMKSRDDMIAIARAALKGKGE